MSRFENRISKLAVLAIGILLVFTLSIIFTVNTGISAFAAETEAFNSEAH